MNNTNRHNSTLVILLLLTTVLVSGFTTNVPSAVFADSRLLEQRAKQTANCDTVGAGSPVSDSCDQRSANIVNNGVPRTSRAAAPNTGTLIVDKACVTSTSGGTCPGNPSFNVQVTGNNAQPTSFSISNGGSQSIILGGGSFTVSEDSTPGFTTSFSGDCMQTSSSGSQEATGTIAAGQHLTCTITNTAVPTTGTLDIIKVCSDFSNGSLCRLNEFDIIVTGNNAQPSSFSLTDGGSRSVTLGPGSFTITELLTPGFLPGSFSGDCTGTISAGQHLTCTVLNEQL